MSDVVPPVVPPAAPVVVAPVVAEAAPAASSDPRVAALEKQITALNAENAERRVKAKEAEAKAAAEVEKAAVASGDHAKIREIDLARHAALTAEIEALKGKAAKADVYEGALKDRFTAALARLPEAQRATYAGLPPEVGLGIVETTLSLIGAPPARTTANGNPAAPSTPATRPEDMTSTDRAAWRASLTTEQKRALLNERTGAQSSGTPFVRVPQRK